MDKFVVRTKRLPKPERESTVIKENKKQVTIESLAVSFMDFCNPLLRLNSLNLGYFVYLFLFYFPLPPIHDTQQQYCFTSLHVFIFFFLQECGCGGGNKTSQVSVGKWPFLIRDNFVSFEIVRVKELIKRCVTVHENWSHSQSYSTSGKQWWDQRTSKACVQKMEIFYQRPWKRETRYWCSLWQENWSYQRESKTAVSWCSSTDGMNFVFEILLILLKWLYSSHCTHCWLQLQFQNCDHMIKKTYLSLRQAFSLIVGAQCKTRGAKK